MMRIMVSDSVAAVAAVVVGAAAALALLVVFPGPVIRSSPLLLAIMGLEAGVAVSGLALLGHRAGWGLFLIGDSGDSGSGGGR